MRKIEWIDWRGKTWDLGNGTEGVILDLDQEGLSWPEMEHVHVRGGQVRTATQLKRAEHDLKVQVGVGLEGEEYYQLREEWWFQANSPWNEGVLRFTRPGGETRWRKLHLLDTPGTSYTYDPGLGGEPPIELWSLTGNGPWWFGPEQIATFSLSGSGQSGSVPFYGMQGHAYPFYISSSNTVSDLYMENRGQGPMWLTWKLEGPLANPVFGVGDSLLSLRGQIPEGLVVTVNTNPVERTVTDDSGMSLYNAVSGRWGAVPIGSRVPLVMSSDGMTDASSMSAIGAATYASPF
ncbi:hypothetical protein [Corynebacterium lubricantis]|uniref:hypothetical protein n=1 Tax=Corynebacterium lubricantis TaxID=541095 RepID=UPI00035EA582|nr:hypothetical protein [Corynebacterium lubricantis]